MKTQAIQPARIDFGREPGAVPRAPDFGDLYHPRIGALEQARHVFLQGNGLPGRWASRAHFVILETGFGLGNNFLATWQAWREDPARCERLHFVSVERHPPTRADLAHAHAHAASPLPELAAALLHAWPPLTPNLQALDFEGGRVQLLLALGDVALLLPALRLQADAFFLDGFAPVRNPEMWQPRVLKALGRKAAADATLATWSVARELREGLTSAGFEVQRAPGIGGKREITVACFAPRFAPRFAPYSRPVTRPSAGDAVVVGAGVAGAAVAQALSRQGLVVTVLDRHAVPAAEASGNPAALYHGSLNADDGRYARLYRAAALEAQRCYAGAMAQGGMAGGVEGLLRLDLQPGGLPSMQALLHRLGLPPAYVQALDAQAASVLAGVPLAAPAWYYPGGGWIDAAAWVRQMLALPGVRFVGGRDVARIGREGGSWVLCDPAGGTLARTPVLVLACAAAAQRLLVPLGHAPWPLSHTRGQVTHWPGTAGRPAPLLRPVAGDGYALPLTDGGLLCGATRSIGEPTDADLCSAPIAAHDLQNLERLKRLTGLVGPPDRQALSGRSGWRLHCEDRLPIAGAMPLAAMPPGQRRDQARLLPREPDLWVLTALGSRGLTLAPLLGRLIAAQVSGTPWPLEQDLADAVDPARWLVRAARRGSEGGG